MRHWGPVCKPVQITCAENGRIPVHLPCLMAAHGLGHLHAGSLAHSVCHFMMKWCAWLLFAAACQGVRCCPH